MAGIMHKTSRLMAAVLLGCLLAGCGGQLLSHREIVRAVFFTAQDVGYTVTLLTSDQQSEDSAACKTFTGSGATCAAAWNAAADVQVLAPGSVRVNLTLRDVELKDLTPAARPDAELQVAFAAAANREFDGLITALYGINGPDADPLDLCFWLQNRYGSTQGALRAELTLHWHRPGEG